MLWPKVLPHQEEDSSLGPRRYRQWKYQHGDCDQMMNDNGITHPASNNLTTQRVIESVTLVLGFLTATRLMGSKQWMIKFISYVDIGICLIPLRDQGLWPNPSSRAKNKRPSSTGTEFYMQSVITKRQAEMMKARATSTKAKVIYMRELREMGLEYDDMKKLVDKDFVGILTVCSSPLTFWGLGTRPP
ncbi:hypothetical protein VP01_7268g1 [Puccinia sorghi]|uniref:Uncharacterized protein n=1 Tax=Puccinia sorghi TaxID=27349 RepID=A0A0L6UD21_9BASI|nr:hypothetical protein VP01_7268g1 [Puccinia sorghi]